MNGRLVAWVLFVLAFSALSYAGRFLFETEIPDDVLYTYSAAIQGVVQYAIILAVVVLIVRGANVRALLALRRPDSWTRAAGISVGIFVAMMILAGALSPFLQPGDEQGLIPERWEPERADALAANFAVVVFVAPVVEELVFRGLGFSLLARFGTAAAIVLVGVAFAVAHGLVEALPLLVAFGAALAYLRARSGSVYPGMILHGFFNAFALVGALVT